LKYSSKKTKRSQINSFFEYFKRRIRRTNPSYYNPIPTLKECNFSADIFNVEEEEKKVKEAIFSIEQMIYMLKNFYFLKKPYFIITLLLSFCGMRISECVSIKIENVNLDKRFLITGIEENARKSNKRGDKPLYFCFPPIVSYLLKEYILELKSLYPNNIWLFIGRSGHLTTSSFQFNLKKKFNAKSHSFRKTLLTFALNLNNSTPLHFTELLTNHKISNVVMNSYNKISIEERVEIYDKFLPKEYSKIIQFCQKL
jgi:integrase